MTKLRIGKPANMQNVPSQIAKTTKILIEQINISNSNKNGSDISNSKSNTNETATISKEIKPDQRMNNTL